MIHALYLQEIDAIEEIIERIEAGEPVASELMEAVEGLDMAENYRLFGNLCGRECHVLTIHHTIEDQELFPRLRDGSDGLRKVVDRLAEEHKVIHAIIERLEAEARELLGTPEADGFAKLKATFALLTGVVRSHFSYEQTELEEAIGHHRVPI